ncbi:unnamed protein product, partial [Dibothriocephalus latus]
MGQCTSTPHKFVKRFNRLKSEDQREVFRLLTQIYDVSVDGFPKDFVDKSINTVSGLFDSASIAPTPGLEYRPFQRLRLTADPLSYTTGFFSENENPPPESELKTPTIPDENFHENQSEPPNVGDMKSTANNSNSLKPEPDAKSETNSGLSACTFTIPLEFQGFMVDNCWTAEKRSSPRQLEEPPEGNTASSRTFPTAAEKAQLV